MKEADFRDISHANCQLIDLFNQTIDTQQISFAQWYKLMTAPLDDSKNVYAQELIPRLIYGVRQGWVKVVEDKV